MSTYSLSECPELKVRAYEMVKGSTISYNMNHWSLFTELQYALKSQTAATFYILYCYLFA